MTAPVSMRERHNSYAVLSTIIGLVIVIVYAENSYDDWDTMIALLGLVVGASFILRVRDADLLETALAGFLVGVSLSLFIVSGLSLVSAGESGVSAWVDEHLLAVSVGIMIVAVALQRILKGRIL